MEKLEISSTATNPVLFPAKYKESSAIISPICWTARLSTASFFGNIFAFTFKIASNKFFHKVLFPGQKIFLKFNAVSRMSSFAPCVLNSRFQSRYTHPKYLHACQIYCFLNLSGKFWRDMMSSNHFHWVHLPLAL